MKTNLNFRSNVVSLILIVGLLAPVSFASANPVNAPQDSTCTAPPQGILSWWSGDGHPFDLVGENDATLTNGATYASGMVGRAFSFDGVDDYLSVPNSASLQAIGDHFSIEAWVRPESLPSGDPYYDKGIVVREGYVRGFALATRGAAFGMWIGGASGTGLTAVSSPVTTDRWYHVVGTYDGSDARIYVDGELEGTRTAPLIHYDTPLMIGTSQINERFFDGQVDEVTIYTRTLTRGRNFDPLRRLHILRSNRHGALLALRRGDGRNPRRPDGLQRRHAHQRAGLDGGQDRQARSASTVRTTKSPSRTQPRRC